jgi:hypothetical protein
MTIRRDAIAGHLDSVGVAELVRGEAAPNAGAGPSTTQVVAGRGVRPVPSARRAGDDAEQRADREPESCLEPRVQVLPAPCIHSDLAAVVLLSLPNEQRAAPRFEIGFGERERFLNP